MISLGTYPEVTLEEARNRRAEARAMLAKGIDPSEERQKAKREVVVNQFDEELMFEVVARNWCKKSRSGFHDGDLVLDAFLDLFIKTLSLVWLEINRSLLNYLLEITLQIRL